MSCFLFIFTSSSLHFQLRPNVFHLFPCNFIQMCFGFLKKSLWFFPMVFDGNPTHFNPGFRAPFGTERVKRSQTVLRSARQHFYANFPLISKRLSCVSYFLVGSEIVGPFFNTLTADNMYSCHSWQKFPQQVQPQSPSKPQFFSAIFTAFLKFT